MPESKKIDELLDAIAKILLRCSIFGFILLLFWLGAITLAGDLVFGVHENMFGIPRPQLKVIHYCGMAFTKLTVALFFIIPWVSIRLALKTRKS